VTVLTPAGATPPTNMHQYGLRAQHVVAERSLHWIHLDEPELIVETILNTVGQTTHDRRSQPSLVTTVHQ